MNRALVERARNGDHDAFADLARAAGDRLVAAATLILGNRDLAEDAVQEALIAAWRGIRALREPDAWDAWLHRLVVRSCYRIGRAKRKVTVVELDLVDHQMGAADATGSFADRDQLERGFARLSVEQRATLVLHYYVGLTFSEAAVVLGIPTGTFKSRLHRATSAMRAALEADQRVGAAPRESVA